MIKIRITLRVKVRSILCLFEFASHDFIHSNVGFIHPIHDPFKHFDLQIQSQSKSIQVKTHSKRSALTNNSLFNEFSKVQAATMVVMVVSFAHTLSLSLGVR